MNNQLILFAKTCSENIWAFSSDEDRAKFLLLLDVISATPDLNYRECMRLVLYIIGPAVWFSHLFYDKIWEGLFDGRDKATGTYFARKAESICLSYFIAQRKKLLTKTEVQRLSLLEDKLFRA
jgi:hypothetical protein